MTNPCNLRFGEAKPQILISSPIPIPVNSHISRFYIQAACGKEVPKGHKMVYINEVVKLPAVIHMHPDKLELAMKKFATVWGGLDLTKNYRLEGMLLLWPGILKCWAASHDHNAISLLDSIAQDGTQTHRPMTQLIVPGTKFDPHITKPVVVKHEASASRLFIKYPGKQKMLNEAEKHGEYQLFKQLYVPEWDKPAGGWMEFAPPSLSITLTLSFRLSKSNPDQCNFMICEGRMWAEISKAQAEIWEFLLTTLAVFIQGEEKMLGHQGLENRL
ncbi:uncharacterized protein BJ212DRAFT_1302789 [Suillus subaureus]|uniref:Uncharacterized protein n=1 Tax=Suillus subaureus TaxID=48587 RepID=A0A9P7E1F0_9AGAM|nr:uncharacterized protein BJ212DRAFT_1302789 [Suillus subaureus]KAG1808888.1 hypothetical protein BJ212DRAFT_1302789 [Suillus subaureus]